MFTIPPLFDDSYYGFPIHEIREMQVMNMGNYAHGNQPIQHMLYMYDWAGQPWSKNYFKHGDLSGGARITYSMSPTPNTRRGTAPEDRPYSFSNDK